MVIIHIVLFEFKPTTTHEQVQEACDRMLVLREKCVHPTTKSTYIKSAVGGRDNSPEGHQGGITHGFVVEFESEGDRAYYLNEDPEHLAFVEYVKKLVKNIRVVDFEPGKF